jgi:hypothetical protein
MSWAWKIPLMNFDPDFLQAVEQQIVRSMADADKAIALLDEQSRLQEMLRTYEEIRPGARQPDDDLLRMLRHRFDAVDEELAKYLPAHAYVEELKRLFGFMGVESVDSNVPEEFVARRRQSQRLRATQRLEALRVAERAKEQEPAAESPLLTGLRIIKEADSFGAYQKAMRDFSTSLAFGAGPPEMSTGDQLAEAAREYLTTQGMSSIKFADLYKYLAVAFSHLFTQSPTPNARLEAFRYHLVRAAEKHGLKYEAGRLGLSPAVDPRVEGEVTTS